MARHPVAGDHLATRDRRDPDSPPAPRTRRGRDPADPEHRPRTRPGAAPRGRRRRLRSRGRRQRHRDCAGDRARARAPIDAAAQPHPRATPPRRRQRSGDRDPAVSARPQTRGPARQHRRARDRTVRGGSTELLAQRRSAHPDPVRPQAARPRRRPTVPWPRWHAGTPRGDERCARHRDRRPRSEGTCAQIAGPHRPGNAAKRSRGWARPRRSHRRRARPGSENQRTAERLHRRDRIALLRPLPVLAGRQRKPADQLRAQVLGLDHRVDHQLRGQVEDVDVLGVLAP